MASETTRRYEAAAQDADRRPLVRAVFTMIGAAAAIFVVGLVLGLVFVGRHGGGPIQGWDNRVQAWDLHHRAGLVGVSKVVHPVGRPLQL